MSAKPVVIVLETKKLQLQIFPASPARLELTLRSRGDQIRQHFTRCRRRPFTPCVVPHRQDFANRLDVSRIYECLADFVAHRVQVGIRNSEFPEGSAGVYGIVKFQRFCKLELDGFALLGYGWR